MGNICPKCGVPMPEGAEVCPVCGEKIAIAKPVKANINLNIKPSWTLVGNILAGLLALLCLFTAFVDSSTFVNRLYTTAIMWNIPLIAIAVVAYAFVKGECKRGNLISVVLLVVAFLFSNITKNSVQDVVSNAENYVEVGKEAVIDVLDDADDWKETIEDVAKDVQKAAMKNAEELSDISGLF